MTDKSELNKLAKGPLAGIRVLDMATMIVGPFAAQSLGDMGADVIKVEPPEGDLMRRIGPRPPCGARRHAPRRTPVRALPPPRP